MDQLRAALHKYWGYTEFRPLQAEAMQCVMTGRDSVVVMPTGGGKSLCFQAPALCLPGLAVVVSPLIALMKDQVDALVDFGIPAACINSTHTPEERRDVAEKIRSGQLKLLYLSPERLMTEQTLQFLRRTQLSFVAIDEAHCISDWGHDFRPEYRSLAMLKEAFPGVAVHSYTATATARVRSDISRQLQLENPEILVGSFDRPNLVYRVIRRTDRLRQIGEVIARHPDESGVIYCIKRADVDSVAESLVAAGIEAVPYHAGMSEEDRRRNQEAFINDQAKIIVATVAFGMGIDKSNVRYVIHAGAPKSLESYQQESGRAGRDGLEAECCLFYSAADFITWRRFQQDLTGPALDAASSLLAGMESFCSTLGCRHRSIVTYFGQPWGSENCQACDACLGELELIADPLVIAQKIISCVLRLRESYGASYTSQVLTGSREARILEQMHDQLSTFGLLAEHGATNVRMWIDQLVDQGFLTKVGEYHVLQATPEGRRVLRGEVTPQLLKPATKTKKTARADTASWEGVDQGLFEALRALRAERAKQRGLPPYVVFSDATLRDLARRRPSTTTRLLAVSGVGEKKAAEYGEEVLATIRDYCDRVGIEQDVTGASSSGGGSARSPAKSSAPAAGAKKQAIELFAQGQSLAHVAATVGRAASTVANYLVEFLQTEEMPDPSPWIDRATIARVQSAAESVGSDRLKPVFDALGGEVSYDQIRLALVLGPKIAAAEAATADDAAEPVLRRNKRPPQRASVRPHARSGQDDFDPNDELHAAGEEFAGE